MIPSITTLQLTRDGVRADDRALHTVIAYATHDETPAVPRVLWCRPERGRVIVQSTRLDLGRMPGLIKSASRAVPVRVDWPAGTRVRVSLIANTRRRHGRQRQPVPDDELPAWLTERLPMLGLDHVDAQPLPAIRALKQQHRITLARTAFCATGTVTGPTALHDIILSGLGGGKAYGCGMLLVTEVSR